MDFISDVSPEKPDDVFMPYTPGVRVKSGSDILFMAGATAAPLYHDHPHDFDAFDLPDDIQKQMRLTLDNLQRVLHENDLTFQHVVKVVIYLTDIREIARGSQVMGDYFDDWKPATTTISVNNLSTPGARVELDMTAVFPPD